MIAKPAVSAAIARKGVVRELDFDRGWLQPIPRRDRHELISVPYRI
jgi:hypothetical protein